MQGVVADGQRGGEDAQHQERLRRGLVLDVVLYRVLREGTSEASGGRPGGRLIDNRYDVMSGDWPSHVRIACRQGNCAFLHVDAPPFLRAPPPS